MKNNFIFKGRRINKILCLSCLFISLIFLAASGVCVLLKNPEACDTFSILTLIMTGFTLLYGLLWFIWGRIEKKAQLSLEETYRQQYTSPDAFRDSYRVFTLPRTHLIKTAQKRYRSVLMWTSVFSLCIFLLIGSIMIASGAMKDAFQALYLLIFCLLIIIPGVLVQKTLSMLYVRRVPSGITLYPGKIMIDDALISSTEIKEILLSSETLHNPNSPAVFRSLQINTGKRLGNS